MGKRIDTKEFIKRAQDMHGTEKYNYNDTLYVNSGVKVKIWCNTHKEFFMQHPYAHVTGSNCKKCWQDIRIKALSSNTDEWIAKAKLAHGNTYDYSETNYVSSRKHVKIICKIHGAFSQSPVNHCRGSGCRLCSPQSALLTTEWIKKAKLVHGDRYDYSKVNYINNSTLVDIICKKHGLSKSSPKSHLKGANCRKCSGVHKLSTNEWIEEAIKIHGSKYDYSLSNYISANKNITIICRTHGAFERPARSHIRNKAGCMACSGVCEYRSDGVKMSYEATTEGWVEAAKGVHGDTYLYNKSIYTSRLLPVVITCRIHGDFSQSALGHVNGSGCRRCSRVHSPSNEEWVAMAREVHGDTYDYSKSVYTKALDKVEIICEIHGSFMQQAASHVGAKQGCPSCGREINGWGLSAWKKSAEASKHFDSFKLYFITLKDKDESFLKIGRTFYALGLRVGSIPYESEEVRVITGSADKIWRMERDTIRAFRGMKYAPKKEFGGKTECFKIDAYEPIKNHIDRL